MENNPELVLGLDLGTSSVGWCLIEGHPLPRKIVAAGVRIFPEGMDRTRGEKSLNQARREARAMRRQGYRRKRRKAKLLHALQDAGLMPCEVDELERIFKSKESESPYCLRSAALRSRLEPYQVGRALYHLGQRRGYLSNRKAGKDNDDGVVAGGISEIEKAIKDGEFSTLGDYLNSLNPHVARVRRRYTSRHMYFDEFSKIWEAQKNYHPNELTSANRKRIFDAIFYQRPLRIQKHLVGKCEFEPSRKRAAAATLTAQEFRVWSTVNHLKMLHSDGRERWLTDAERIKLHDELDVTDKLSWERIRQLLNVHEDTHFNLEQTYKAGPKGNVTAHLIGKAIGQRDWSRLNDRQRENLTFDLLNMESDSALARPLREYWGFDERQTAKLLKNGRALPKGYMHLSHKVLRTIVPHLASMGHADGAWPNLQSSM